MIDAKITIFTGNTSPIDKIREILKGKGTISRIRGIDIKGKYHIKLKEISIKVDDRLQFIRFLDKLRDIQEIHILSVKDAREKEKS